MSTHMVEHFVVVVVRLSMLYSTVRLRSVGFATSCKNNSEQILNSFFVGELAKMQPSATPSSAWIWALCTLGTFPYFIYTSLFRRLTLTRNWNSSKNYLKKKTPKVKISMLVSIAWLLHLTVDDFLKVFKMSIFILNELQEDTITHCLVFMI